MSASSWIHSRTLFHHPHLVSTISFTIIPVLRCTTTSAQHESMTGIIAILATFPHLILHTESKQVPTTTTHMQATRCFFVLKTLETESSNNFIRHQKFTSNKRDADSEETRHRCKSPTIKSQKLCRE